MRKIIYLFTIFITHNALGQANLPQYEWTATLKVVDDDGKPVAGAEAGVGTGTLFKKDGLTESNGIFVATHRDATENLAFHADKQGYYPFFMSYHKGRVYNAAVWNPTQIVILKRIKTPIPMYAKWVNVGMPVFDKPAGFDLTLGDWVSPYGKGINSDIMFTAHREKRAQDYSDYQLVVSFPNPGDGIQDFKVPQYYLHTEGSALKSSQDAPVDGYQPKWVQTKTRRPGKPVESNWDQFRAYYFRVRSKLDKNGNVVTANYGKIYGDFMNFHYYLNPTPNDPNVEFDPKRNLLHGLKPMEQVSDP